MNIRNVSLMLVPFLVETPEHKLCHLKRPVFQYDSHIEYKQEMNLLPLLG
jgi:hypothetical protein